MKIEITNRTYWLRIAESKLTDIVCKRKELTQAFYEKWRKPVKFLGITLRKARGEDEYPNIEDLDTYDGMDLWKAQNYQDDGIYTEYPRLSAIISALRSKQTGIIYLEAAEIQLLTDED